MSFQASSESLRARLHLSNVHPAVLFGVLLAGALVAAGAIFGMAHALQPTDLVVERGNAETVESSHESEKTLVQPTIYVHVSGCVAVPGLYALDEGTRVADAVAAAGGLSDSAAPDAVNLARVLFDGEQIVIPSVDEASVSTATGTSSAPSAATRVNINTATAEQLRSLDGIGEATAAKIIADRETNGPYKTIEDLKRVSGIGDKKFEGLKDSICVG